MRRAVKVAWMPLFMKMCRKNWLFPVWGGWRFIMVRREDLACRDRKEATTTPGGNPEPWKISYRVRIGWNLLNTQGGSWFNRLPPCSGCATYGDGVAPKYLLKVGESWRGGRQFLCKLHSRWEWAKYIYSFITTLVRMNVQILPASQGSKQLTYRAKVLPSDRRLRIEFFEFAQRSVQ